MNIRGGSGLGDALYLRPVAEHFVTAGAHVTVLTDYGDVFIGAGVSIERHRKTNFNVLAHYTHGKADASTNQWQDVCKSAAIPEIPLSFRWQVQNRLLVDDLKAMARGKPIIMVNGGRPPMGRADGYAKEMLPRRRAFDAVLAALHDCFIVEVGKGCELYPISADVDYVDRTSVADLLDIATVSSGLVGQCSFMIPLAEVFDKPLLCVWAAQGLVSNTLYIRQCTPAKILSKASSRFVMDDCGDEEIADSARAFRQLF